MYAKLFAQVVASSLTHNETIDVRGVFFMLLAIADKEGHVPGVDASIARIINVPLETFERALERLMMPDPASQSQAFEGRRILRLEGNTGLFIVNYGKYQGILNDEQRRAYFRGKKAEQRAREAANNGEVLPGTKGRTRSNNKPVDLDEVVRIGALLNVPEPVCRMFYLHYESRAREDENGQMIWVTGETGEKVVGQWKSLLASWWVREQEKTHQQKLRRRDRSEMEKEPEDVKLKRIEIYGQSAGEPTGEQAQVSNS